MAPPEDVDMEHPVIYSVYHGEIMHGVLESSYIDWDAEFELASANQSIC